MSWARTGNNSATYTMLCPNENAAILHADECQQREEKSVWKKDF